MHVHFRSGESSPLGSNMIVGTLPTGKRETSRSWESIVVRLMRLIISSSKISEVSTRSGLYHGWADDSKRARI